MTFSFLEENEKKSFFKSSVLKGIVLFLLAAAIYIPSLEARFIWDDNTFFDANPIMEAPNALYRFWFTKDAPDYFPLVSTNLWVQRQLWDIEPLGYHSVNILFHAANVVLFWLILSSLNVPGSWLAALVFAWHPIQTESVSWVTQIKNVQSTFFYLLAVLYYLKYDSRGGTWRMSLSLFFFLCALISKTAVVMLPVVLFLYHLTIKPMSLKELSVRTGPFFAMSLVFGLITIWFQYTSAGASGKEWSMTFVERTVNAGFTIWFYIQKIFIPLNLTFIYPRWNFDPSTISSWAPHLMLVVVLFLILRNREKWGGYPTFAIGYFLVSLFPVMGFLNIYFFLYSFVADHYQYIAGQGIIALIVCGGAAKATNLSERYPNNNFFRFGFLIVVCAVTLFLGFMTWNQQKIYQNPIALWNDTIKKNPKAWIAHNNLGNEYSKAGRFDLAVKNYSDTLKVKPDYAEAEDNLGLALLKLNRPEESKAHFLRSIRLDSSIWEAHNNLGTIYGNEGNMSEAAKHFEAALKINPRNTEIHNNLGLVYGTLNRREDALRHFDFALQDSQIRHYVHTNIGNYFMQEGNDENALFHFRKALQIDPNHEDARKKMEKILSKYSQKN
jgi:tetratricopeptide (TPR) repeat protein